MGEVGYSKSQPQESKFDFRAIVGQQFFFFLFFFFSSIFLFLPSLAFSPPTPSSLPEGEGESS